MCAAGCSTTASPERRSTACAVRRAPASARARARARAVTDVPALGADSVAVALAMDGTEPSVQYGGEAAEDMALSTDERRRKCARGSRAPRAPRHHRQRAGRAQVLRARGRPRAPVAAGRVLRPVPRPHSGTAHAYIWRSPCPRRGAVAAPGARPHPSRVPCADARRSRCRGSTCACASAGRSECAGCVRLLIMYMRQRARVGRGAWCGASGA